MQKLLVLLFVWLAGAAAAQHPISFLNIPPRSLEVEPIGSANSSQIYPFELVRGMIYVSASLNGQPGQYILDTGAPCVVVNTLPGRESVNEGHSIAQPIAVAYGSAQSFDFAGRSRRNITTLAVDISHLERAANRTLAGLVGYEEFKDSELYLNYPGRQISVFKPGLNRLHRTGKPLFSLPFVLDGHLPILEVTVDGQVMRFGIDTGAGANLIDPAALARLNTAAFRQLDAETLQGLDQQIRRAERIAISRLEIQNMPVENMAFLKSDLAGLKSGADLHLDGLLGYTFLQHYKLSIDYTSRQLHIWGITP
jgi:predicted aspartyl protease